MHGYVHSQVPGKESDAISLVMNNLYGLVHQVDSQELQQWMTLQGILVMWGALKGYLISHKIKNISKN